MMGLHYTSCDIKVWADSCYLVDVPFVLVPTQTVVTRVVACRRFGRTLGVYGYFDDGVFSDLLLQ